MPTAADRVEKDQWLRRIDAFRQVFKDKREEDARRLRDAVAGRFPRVVVDGMVGLTVIPAEQYNVNLCLQAMNFLKSQTFVEFPQLQQKRVGDLDEQVWGKTDTLISSIMEQGGATEESRQAVVHAGTTGAWLMWYGLDDEGTTPQKLADSFMPSGTLVAQAAAGLPVEVRDGMDFLAIRAIANNLLSTPDQQYALSPEQRDNVMRVAYEAAKKADEELDAPKSVLAQPRKMWFRFLPLGTKTAWDCSVYDRRFCRWAAYLLTLTREEVDAFPAFSKAAKKEILLRIPKKADGYEPVKVEGMTEEDVARENGRATVWCIFDRVRERRLYVSDCYKDGFLNEDTSYPYLGEDGRPLIKDFFPLAVVTPIESDDETPERTFGYPLLLPGWNLQIEFIKTHNAYVQAVKRTGRTFEVESGVDEPTLVRIAMGADGNFVQRPAGMSGPGQQNKQAISLLPNPPAPRDYLECMLRIKAEFASAVHIALASLTGEPMADTLGQEELAMSGATSVQADFRRMFEGGFAKVAMDVRTLARRYLTDEQVAGILGKEFVTDTPAIDPATGQQAMKDGKPAFNPSPWKRYKATLVEDKIDCVFASRKRQEEFIARKQEMDFVALLERKVNALGMPRYDDKPYIEAIAKGLSLAAPAPYKPDETEQMLAVMQQMGAGAGGGEGAPPEGGDPTSRTAGGGRGQPSIPDAQKRGRGPPKRGDLQGGQVRNGVRG